MPRFVVLEHHYQGVHWDFMLEFRGVLRTWKLVNEPAADLVIRATPLADHRILYLDYEGEISGGRGSVTQWDRGEFEWVSDEPDEVAVRLSGRRLEGTVHLRMSDADWSFLLTSAGSVT